LEETKALIDSLEDAATTALQKKVKALLESSGAAGWAVVDGVVYATHPKHGDLVPVSSLSTGELDRLALGLLLSKQEKKENLSLGKPSKPKTTFLSPPADLRQKTR
jgi:hypothetical protein